jgi:hypothetical protein
MVLCSVGFIVVCGLFVMALLDLLNVLSFASSHPRVTTKVLYSYLIQQSLGRVLWIRDAKTWRLSRHKAAPPEAKTMAKRTKGKQEQELDNGEVVYTTADGWDPEATSELPVLIAGWNPGQGSHHGISLGMALACKEKVPGCYLGDFNGVPVVDPAVINEAMEDAFTDKFGIEVERVRGASSRVGAKMKLAAVNEALKSIPAEVVALMDAATRAKLGI